MSPNFLLSITYYLFPSEHVGSLLTKVPVRDVVNSYSVSCQVKDIEERDSVLTPKQQIDRLLRAGSTYFNLNPYDVSRPADNSFDVGLSTGNVSATLPIFVFVG